eukprot:gene56306-52922_t
MIAAGFANPVTNGRYVRDDARTMHGRHTYRKGVTRVMYWCARSDGTRWNQWRIATAYTFHDPSRVGPDVCGGDAAGVERDEPDPRRASWEEQDGVGVWRVTPAARVACGDGVMGGHTAAPVAQRD